MTKPKRDLSNPTITEAMFLNREETSDRIDEYTIIIDDEEIPVCRFKHRDTNNEDIMMPLSKSDAVVIMPFFKKGDVNDEYMASALCVIYNVVNYAVSSNTDFLSKYVMCEDNFVEVCSIAGVVLLKGGECAISGADTVWCLPLPRHLKDQSIDEVKDFFAKHKRLLAPPNMALFDLPDTVTCSTPITLSAVH